MSGCSKDLFQLICSQCDLQELTKALQETGLSETLSDLDFTTVFAPTNRAFKTFGGGSTCGTLTEILLYHVVDDKLKPCSLQNDTVYPTLREGENIRINVYEKPLFRDAVTVNGVEVLDYVKSGDNILYKIDKVLCPPAGTVWELAQSTPDLSILAAAVETAGLVDALNDPSANLTVFAPTNSAFEDLLAETGLTLEQLLASPSLSAVLLYHVLGQTVFSAALKRGLTPYLLTLEGKTLDICNKYCKVLVIDQLDRKSKIVAKDVLAVNGVVHVVDKVLLPFSL